MPACTAPDSQGLEGIIFEQLTQLGHEASMEVLDEAFEQLGGG
jgi:hypothetical protein